MKERLIYLTKVYLITVCIFVIAKVVFMVANYEGHAFGARDVWEVVRHGLTLDLSTAIYIISIPFLLLIVSVWRMPKGIWTVFKIYYGIISFAMMLAFTADTSLYPFWGFKLDASCLQYLASPAEAKASVSGGYMAVRIVVVVAGTWILYKIYKGVRGFGGTRVREYSVARKARSSIFYLICIPLMVIGIRGGLDESTTNIGQVYFSQDQFLNHSAVNPVFSFFASLESTSSDNTVYDFYTPAELKTLTDGLYHSESVAGDTLLRTQRPDVVVILLESCGSMFLNVMPNLRHAAQEGIDFTNCYGNSYRTDRGTVCALSGYLSFPTMSVMKMSNKVSHLPSIARSLQKVGYSTDYLYGGDINFTKMKGYLISTGFERLYWKQDYTQEEQATSKWGVRDDITFKTLSEIIRKRGGEGKRFLIGYSTLSSHEPWDVPVDKYKEKQYNGFSYVDDCIGTFIREMKQSKQWDNLLIVLTADHGINYKDIDEQQPLKRNHIPLLMVGGAVKEPLTVTALCNQTDISATLLGLLGLPHDDFRFSRDVLSESYRYPTAVHNYYNAQLLIDSTGYILYDFDAQRFTVSQTADPERLLRINKAILQTTTNDLMNR